MRYFVMEPNGNKQLPVTKCKKGPEVVLVPELKQFNKIDYDTRSKLISEKLKLLIEMFMPKYDYVPVVYLDLPKKEQLVVYRFEPSHFDNCQATYRNDGVLSHITLYSKAAPIIFTAKSPKGVCSIVVNMAVAESILRRKILGVSFTKVTDS
jgi:hypothetical protein